MRAFGLIRRKLAAATRALKGRQNPRHRSQRGLFIENMNLENRYRAEKGYASTQSGKKRYSSKPGAETFGIIGLWSGQSFPA